MGALSPPALLAADHVLTAFRCSEPSLGQWLLRRAMQNHVSGALRTYVVCDSRDVVGYYCLAAGAVAIIEAPGSVRRNMPDPIPVIVLGRLAVHLACERQGVGTALLKDALLRCLTAAEHIGVRALMSRAVRPSKALLCQSWVHRVAHQRDDAHAQPLRRRAIFRTRRGIG